MLKRNGSNFQLAYLWAGGKLFRTDPYPLSCTSQITAGQTDSYARTTWADYHRHLEPVGHRKDGRLV